MREQNRPGGLSLINPPGLYDPAPNGYSHVALLPPGARLAFIAGQGGETADGQLSEDFRQQVRQALRNLCIAIEAAGGTPQQIAKLGVLIVDHSEARLQVFGDELARARGPGPKPACTLIPRFTQDLAHGFARIHGADGVLKYHLNIAAERFTLGAIEFRQRFATPANIPLRGRF